MKKRITAFFVMSVLISTLFFQVTVKADSNVVNITEDIFRFYGSNRFETSYVITEALALYEDNGKFDTMVVTCGDNFPDALSGSYLATKKGAPILLVSKNTVKDVNFYIENYLEPDGTVYLLGGEKVVPASVGKNINEVNVVRLSGPTRYETNLAILKEAGVKKEDILICTGKGFADSLSASAANLPILLVGDEITKEQKSFLKNTSGDKIIIGGTSAVSKSIESKLDNSGYGYGDVERIGGSTRFETSVLVALRLFDHPAIATVAYSHNFPDGLCGGPLAYFYGSPMILTANGYESVAKAYMAQQNIDLGIVLGGNSLISDKTAKNMFSGYSNASAKAYLPDLSAFLKREPDRHDNTYREGKLLQYKNIPDKYENTVVKQVVALLQEDQYQLELVAKRTFEYANKTQVCYDFLYTGEADNIDLLSRDVKEGCLYNVELKVDFMDAKDSTAVLNLHFGNGFSIADPGKTTSVKLSGPVNSEDEDAGRGDCLTCGGTGDCYKCDGAGERYKWVAGTVRDYVLQDCTSCVGGECRVCSGSGDR